MHAVQLVRLLLLLPAIALAQSLQPELADERRVVSIYRRLWQNEKTTRPARPVHVPGCMLLAEMYHMSPVVPVLVLAVAWTTLACAYIYVVGSSKAVEKPVDLC